MSVINRATRWAEETVLLTLGRPQLLLHGHPYSLPTRKSMALIAYLAVEGGTSRAMLAELLWTDLDPFRARANLRRELHRLRATPVWTLLDIGLDLLGFSLPLSTDLSTFLEHLVAGRPGEALDEYRGPFLQELDVQGAEAFEEWLARKRSQLAERRQQALGQHARTLELEGDLRGALEAQLAVLCADELQEHAHAEGMRLHALLGERDLALRLFDHLKLVLGTQLGLEPLPETVALAAHVRESDLPDLRPNGPPTTPMFTSPLVGREVVWNTLVRSSASVCLIVSEPGVGKTRLALDFAHSRASSLLIQGLEISSQTPLSSLAQALRNAWVDPASQARLAGLEPVWRHEAAWLVPELDAEYAAARPSPEGRERFLEGLARALATAAGPGGTVVFDDVHWCDASTAEVALHLSRLAAKLKFRLVLTARTAELQDNVAATGLLAALDRATSLHRIELEALTSLDVLTLVRALSGGMQAQLFSKRLYEATGGNPLYILETLRALFAGGLLTVTDGGWSTPFDDATENYAELPIPTSVREAVLRRVDALGGAARRLLELASLAGNGFRLDSLTGASALTEWEQIGAVEQALSVNLLTPLGGGYTFSHGLVRRALDDAIGPERRARSHQLLAGNLIRSGGMPGQIADHLERAGRPGDAASYRILAAEEATRVFAHREALTQYRSALHDGLGGSAAVRVHLASAELLSAVSDYPAAFAELTQAAQLTALTRDDELEAQVSLAQISVQNALGDYAGALRLTDHLLSRRSLPALIQVQALYGRGAALLRLGNLDEAEPCFQSVLTQAPPEAHDLIGNASTQLQGCAMQRGQLRLAQTYNAAALEAFRAAGNRAGTVRALGGSGLLIGLQGDAAAAVPVLAAALEEARAIGDIGVQRTLLLNSFKFLLESGDLEAAVPRLEEGLALARDPQDPYLEGVFLNNLGVVHRLRGDLGAALKAVAAALDLADRTCIVQHQVRRRLTLAEAHLDLGDPAGASLLLETAGQLATPSGLGEVRAWLENLLARTELVSGQPGAVLGRLERLQVSGITIDADDRMRTAWLSGQAHFALGDPQQALNGIMPLNLPHDPLLLGWALSIRLEAQARLRLSSADDRGRAEDLLASRQMYPLEMLGLERALGLALSASGETGRAEEHFQAVRKRVLLLGESLSDHAALRRSFLEQSGLG